jgi:uncharacterized Zn-binding protein involved in type VI secretion
MAFTIHVNGRSNSLVHKGSMGIAKSTMPDVCKTPSPGGPVPVPYPVIVSLSSDLTKGTKTVKVEGKKMAAIKGSEFSRCTGDEPGTAGGVKSSTNMKEATWILYSFDVKLDGKNACRLSDKMMMNHGNTVCLAGENDASVSGDDYDCDEGANKIESLLCRNKHEHGGSGDHGYLMRFAEQMCGKEGPGTDSFKKHQEQLEATRKGLLKEIDAFEAAGCNLDDYEFHTKRSEKDRTGNIREAIAGIRNGDASLIPSAAQSGFLGRAHPACRNLAGDRTDRTLNAIRGIIGF